MLVAREETPSTSDHLGSHQLASYADEDEVIRGRRLNMEELKVEKYSLCAGHMYVEYAGMRGEPGEGFQ